MAQRATSETGTGGQEKVAIPGAKLGPKVMGVTVDRYGQREGVRRADIESHMVMTKGARHDWG